jgi:hypothetical protein
MDEYSKNECQVKTKDYLGESLIEISPINRLIIKKTQIRRPAPITYPYQILSFFQKRNNLFADQGDTFR